MIDAHANITVHLNIPDGPRQAVKYYFVVPAGRSRVRAENGAVTVSPIRPVAR